MPRSARLRRAGATAPSSSGSASLGEVNFVNPDASAELALTLDVLIQQKSKSFARMGVPNMFARPGYVAFYRELATSPRMRALVHLSRLDVGATWAALNLGLTFRDCYIHILASYDDGEVSRFGPGAAHLRELLALRDRARLQALRLHHRRRALQARLVRHRAAAVRPFGRHDAARLARGRARRSRWRRAKRAIKQTAPLWNAVVRVRAARCSVRKQAKSEDNLAQPGSRPLACWRVAAARDKVRACRVARSQFGSVRSRQPRDAAAVADRSRLPLLAHAHSRSGRRLLRESRCARRAGRRSSGAPHWCRRASLTCSATPIC